MREGHERLRVIRNSCHSKGLTLSSSPPHTYSRSVRKCLEKYARFMNLEPSKWQQLSSNITKFAADVQAGKA